MGCLREPVARADSVGLVRGTLKARLQAASLPSGARLPGEKMDILALFGIKQSQAPEETHDSAAGTIRKISDSLDKMEPAEAKYIASFAYVLGRIAHADLNISDEEVSEMERIVQGLGNLAEEQAVLVVQIAKTQNKLFGSTENFVVTREFRKIATREQKTALMNCLFAVSASDESISSIEDNEIRRISREIGLDHRDFIVARSSYKEHLEVLKKRPSGAA